MIRLLSKGWGRVRRDYCHFLPLAGQARRPGPAPARQRCQDRASRTGGQTLQQTLANNANTILIVDLDLDTFASLESYLRFDGFDLVTTNHPDEAVELVYSAHPQVAVVAAGPASDLSQQLCHRLRGTPLSRSMPVIVVGRATSADEVTTTLEAGADDYIRLPFDPDELLARVKRSFVRWRAMRAINPLSNLPGNVDLSTELSERINSKLPTALLYVDLDNFKAYNDRYGFLRGDEALKLMTRCVMSVIRGRANAFAGHIGGDDFAIVIDSGAAVEVASNLVDLWDERVRTLYHPADAARGFIELTDRKGNLTRVGLLSVSIGVATTENRTITTAAEFAHLAAEMKQAAKLKGGSGFLLDRRADPVIPDIEAPRSARPPAPPATLSLTGND